MQDAQSAECVPATRFAAPAFHVEVDRIGMGLVERPAPVLMLSLRDQPDCFGSSHIGWDARAAQVVQSPQHVVVLRRRAESRPVGIDHLAG